MKPTASAEPAGTESLAQAGAAIAYMAYLKASALESAPALLHLAGSLGTDTLVMVAFGIMPFLLSGARVQVSVWVVRGFFFLVGIVLICQHHFLIKTGGYLTWPLIEYTIGNLGEVSGVVRHEIGADQVLHLMAVPLVVGLAAWITQWIRNQAAAKPLGFALLMVPAAGVLWSTDPGSRFYASGRFESIVRPLSMEGSRLPQIVEEVVPYQPPQLVGSPSNYPDVLLLVLESTRADVIEGATPAMPFLAELSTSSTIYPRAYATTTHTSKALVGMLCGMYPRPGMDIVESQPGGIPLTCLPRILNELGYYTTFLQSADGDFENRPGLTSNLGFSALTTRSGLSPDYLDAGYFARDDFALLDAVRSEMDSAGRRPVFMTVLTSLTHYPYALPGELRPRAGPLVPEPRSAYDKVLAHNDRFVAQLIDTIAGIRRLDDVLLIIAGDHGEAFGEHGTYIHDGVPHEEVVRSLLVVRYPGSKGGQVDHALRQHVDILPTVLDALGLKWRGHLPGRSLRDPDGHPVAVTSCWYRNRCHSAISASGHKLIYQFDAGPGLLYELNRDPYERENLISQAGYSLVAHELLGQIARHIAFVSESYRSPIGHQGNPQQEHRPGAATDP